MTSSWWACFVQISWEINVSSTIHYGDVIMDAIASQIISLTIVYSIVYSDADQRKHQSSASLAFVRGIHRGPVNSPHKWPVTRKMFPFDDVIMICPNGDDTLLQGSLWKHVYIIHHLIGTVNIVTFITFLSKLSLLSLLLVLIVSIISKYSSFIHIIANIIVFCCCHHHPHHHYNHHLQCHYFIMVLNIWYRVVWN